MTPETEETMPPAPAIRLLDLTVEQLKEAVVEAGHPAYRAQQLADWVYKKAVTDPAAMTNVPADLKSQVVVLTSKVATRSDSADGTIKLLLELRDGEHIECVMIPTEQRATACLSTQVGCGMGCQFCASGIDGMKRNLTSGEILEEILHLQQAAGRRITHVVFMGMGEPLANYDATLGAVRAINDPERLNVSARHITISTVGIPRAIRRLAKEDMPVTLAISLHAPNDVLRKELIPASERYPIADIIDAAREMFNARGREITLEYILLDGVNDSMVCAEALVRIAQQLRCNINLIKYNPVPSLPFKRSSQTATKAFIARLERYGLNVHVRRSRGLDADAACGQLRRNRELQQDASQVEVEPTPADEGDSEQTIDY